MAYLTRGRGDKAVVLQEIRQSPRLGPKVAHWMEQNEDKLRNHPALQPKRSEALSREEAPPPPKKPPPPAETGKGSEPEKGSSGRKEDSGKYQRSMAERRKALLRDAKDPNSGLTQEQREFILKHDGNRVPDRMQVHHEPPLYEAKTNEAKAKLDIAENMKTVPKPDHTDLHRVCGDIYHYYPR